MKKIILIIMIVVAIFTQQTYANEAMTTNEDMTLNEAMTSNETVILNGQVVGHRDYSSEFDMKVMTPINSQYNMLTDFSNGYSMYYPSHMNIDVSLSPFQVLIFDENMRIEIYEEDLSNNLAQANDYIFYSNRFIKNQTDHTKTYEDTLVVNDKAVHILKWERRKLARIPNDKNYYLSAEIVKDQNHVYSIFFKSSVPLNDEFCKEIIESFQCIEKVGTPYLAMNESSQHEGSVNIKKVDEEQDSDELVALDESVEPVDSLELPEAYASWNEETQNFYKDYFVNNQQLTWGIYDPMMPKLLIYYKRLEKKLDFKFPFILKYHNFPSRDTSLDIYKALKTAHKDGRHVELTLQTSRISEEEGNIVYDILDGEYDDFLNEYAQMLREFGHPIMFRLNNEMNGDWCDYSSFHTSKDTLIYKALYQYVYKVFRDNNVSNVIWVWNPHDKSFPDFKWNHSLMYYPDQELVDIVGLTGYNTGTYYPGEVWRGFNEIYDDLYEEYDRYFDKPFMITEFSTSCYGGEKNVWIQEMFDNITKYEKIKAAIWWNGWDYDSDGTPARIYRLDQSPNMINIFKERFEKFK